MEFIYTCQQCGKQYTIYEEGDYICGCGNRFHYPSATSCITANYVATPPVFIGSETGSFKKHIQFHQDIRDAQIEDCPLAKISLICAFLSIPFFGILAIPALILGFAARMMISTPKYRYTGDGIAIAGIVIATISLSAWGIWLMTSL